jgi:hypothetical protein
MPRFTDDENAPAPRFSSGTGGGVYPKAIELFECLVMITPIEIETVPGFGGKGTAERLTADTVVFEGERAGEYPSMWWGQQPIVRAAAEGMRRGDGTILLGRLVRFPTSANKTQYKDRAALEKALATWRPGKPEIQYAWALEKFTPEDQAKAEKYLRGELVLAPAEPGEEEKDPFADD